MFRVNSTEWIAPRAVGIQTIAIENVNNWGDEAYSVHIESEADDYDSDIFPTFEEAEAYVKTLVEMIS